jgi:hypothetical protein
VTTEITLTDAVHIDREPANQAERNYALDIISRMPSLVASIRRLSKGSVFRVVMSEKNAHLFKQGKDGFWKPFLHDGKKFKENVNLAKVPPDCGQMVTDLALQVNMAVIAIKLEAIEIGVQNIARLIANTQRGKVKGRLDALAAAQALVDPVERRGQMISACRELIAEVGALTGQLKSHVIAMPTETTGLLDGFFGSGLDRAKSAYEEVEYDVSALIQAVNAFLSACRYIREAAFAREALTRIISGLKEASLSDGARKARLVPVANQGIPPEQQLMNFLDAVELMDHRLLVSSKPGQALISLDVEGGDL